MKSSKYKIEKEVYVCEDIDYKNRMIGNETEETIENYIRFLQKASKVINKTHKDNKTVKKELAALQVVIEKLKGISADFTDKYCGAVDITDYLKDEGY